MSYILNLLNKKRIQVIAFSLFVILSTVASLNLFASYFLNKGANGDEYYRENIYTFSNIDFEKITYIPAQLYILLASFFNIFLDNTLPIKLKILLIYGFKNHIASILKKMVKGNPPSFISFHITIHPESDVKFSIISYFHKFIIYIYL